MALALPILALLWLVMVFLLPTNFHTGDILRGLAAILLAGGTRGLILALPSVMAAGLVRSNSRGLVFRRANILQHFHRVKVLVTDRVGVLTRRQAEVEKVKILGSTSTERIYMETAGALAEAAHPLLQALHRFLSERAESESRPLSVIRRPGGGLEAEIAGRILLVGHPWFLEREGVQLDEAQEIFDDFSEEGLSIVALAVDGKMRAVFGLRVDARPEAPSMIRRLKNMGISIMLLTGEGEGLARRVAESHGIDEFHGALGSEERAKLLREKTQGDDLVAALGIGNHDTPVLAASHFPVSLGADAPSEKPGLLVASGRPAELLDALAFSQHTDALVRQNFWLAGGLVVLSLLLAFSGILGPLGCAAMRVIAVQAPLANSLRTHSFRFESNSS
jgi:P-type E1-E2 ATPase